MKPGWLLFFCTSMAAIVAAPAECRSAERLNVLLIVVDDMNNDLG